jgi:autotransporter passenger strand-loop-strand repeat protein
MAIFIVSSGRSLGGITLAAFDEMQVLSGGMAESIVVDSRGNFYVGAGAESSFALVASGGGMFVTGSASGTVVSGGTEYVQGGTANGDTLVAGGVELVAAGLATSSLLEAGGAQVLDGGDSAAVVVSSGAVQLVSAGGVADGTLVDSGGFQEIFSGGVASGTVVQSGGTVVVLPGGVLTSAALAPGAAVVSTGVVVNLAPSLVELFAGSADGLIIGALASDYVLTGGAVSATTVSSGGVQYVAAGGLAAGTLLLAGGMEIVSGGVAFGTQVSGQDATAHSFQNVIAGGVASGTVVDAGGAQNVSGAAAYETVLSGGAQFVEAATVSGTQIDGGGYQYIGAGGVAEATAVDGGSQNVSGGVAYDSVVLSGAFLGAGFGGLVSGMVLSGGTAVLGPDGAAVDTVVDSGGVLTLAGGTATGTVINAGGAAVVSGNARFPAAVSEDFSTVISAGGSELVAAQGLVENVTLAGGVLGFADGGSASGGIFFSGGGTVFIDQPELPTAVFSGFAPGDTIALSQVTSGPGDYVLQDGSAVVVAAGGQTYDLTMAGYAPGTLALSAGSFGELVLIETAPCFVAGTLILTPRGEVPVERLRVGDLVITAPGVDAPVRWIGRRHINVSRHPRPALVWPVVVAADALAEGVPARDLWVSPDHALFIDGVLIPAKALLNGRNVRQARVAAVTYYHVELDAHAVMFAQGCAVESYLETGNRGAFENGGPALRLHPDFAQAQRRAGSCAQLLEEGAVVAGVRARLWRRAQTPCGGTTRGCGAEVTM